MEALDGNAIAGDLFEIFGREMTTATGVCAECDTPAQLAELLVYLRTPGKVVRCRHCSSVMFVLINIRGVARLHTAGFRLDEDERG